MKIAIVTEAADPQVNGVVTTLKNVVRILRSEGHDIKLFTPNSYYSVPIPFYPEVPLVLMPWPAIKDIMDFKPDAIHIATEGPLGALVARHCSERNIPYTTSYHTDWPSIVKKFLPFIPKSLVHWFLRQTHKKSSGILVTNTEMRDILLDLGYKNLIIWSRGVDKKIFNPTKNKRNILFPDASKVFLYVGRVSPEKNIKEFLDLDISCTKVVVGDGPDLEKLKLIYPDVMFVGLKLGEELASYYASADVFVFPSRSDTFGVVMLEALASGLPIAAYPVTGPNEIVIPGVNGYISENLKDNCLNCLTISKEDCIKSADKWTWENTAKIFKDNLKLINY